MSSTAVAMTRPPLFPVGSAAEVAKQLHDSRNRVPVGGGDVSSADIAVELSTNNEEGGGKQQQAGSPLPTLSVEILKDKLYFASLGSHPESTESMKYFTIDYDLVYEPFFADFGPLHLGHLVAFSRALNYQLCQVDEEAKVVFYTSHNGHQRANAACLMACYCVVELKMSPKKAWSIFENAYPPFLPFRDASYGVSTFPLSIYDIICGLHKAVALKWFDITSFDLEGYAKWSSIEHGDWNWIIPKKFIGFSSPNDDIPGREARRLVRPFRDNGTQLVIRLNERTYEKRTFTEVGMRFLELPFPDGHNPTDAVASQFLNAVENQSGVIAVHCRQGVGRTGTMIGIYAMKHYGFNAREFIGWARLCRPGSVLGQQQQYLVDMERRLKVFVKKQTERLPYTVPGEAERLRLESEEHMYSDAAYVAKEKSRTVFKYSSSMKLYRESDDKRRQRAATERSFTASQFGSTMGSRAGLGATFATGTVGFGGTAPSNVVVVGGIRPSTVTEGTLRPRTNATVSTQLTTQSRLASRMSKRESATAAVRTHSAKAQRSALVGRPAEVLSDLKPPANSHAGSLYRPSVALDGTVSAALPTLLHGDPAHYKLLSTQGTTDVHYGADTALEGVVGDSGFDALASPPPVLLNSATTAMARALKTTSLQQSTAAGAKRERGEGEGGSRMSSRKSNKGKGNRQGRGPRQGGPEEQGPSKTVSVPA